MNKINIYIYIIISSINKNTSDYGIHNLHYTPQGSGKTYTIGVDNVAAQTPDEYGILPRSLQEIFEKIDHDEDKRDFVIKISYVEIYKEEVLFNINLNKFYIYIYIYILYFHCDIVIIYFQLFDLK